MAQDNLTIILTHLAENAAELGATLLEVAQADGGNTLTLRDDGPGIPQENHARIFDPFFTTRAEDGGTGMGLGIVSEIIAAAQGRISLVPTKTGALFSISFNADLGPR
jgi:signal transduction histidine kinase